MIKSAKSKTFEKEVLQQDKPTIVDVYTNSCPNCKILAPIFEATAQDNSNKYNFYTLDARENTDIVKRYKILGVPTLLFFSHGVLVAKKTGVIKQEKIEKILIPISQYTKEIAVKNERKGFFKMPWK